MANLPYHITSPILHALLGAPPRPERRVLMVQREVAERIAGAAGADELPVRLRAVPRPGPDRVPRAADAFEPEPAVESAVIVVEPFDADDRLDPEPRTSCGASSRPRFRERRKMLHNVLARQLPVDARRA